MSIDRGLVAAILVLSACAARTAFAQTVGIQAITVVHGHEDLSNGVGVAVELGRSSGGLHLALSRVVAESNREEALCFNLLLPCSFGDVAVETQLWSLDAGYSIVMQVHPRTNLAIIPAVSVGKIMNRRGLNGETRGFASDFVWGGGGNARAVHAFRRNSRLRGYLQIGSLWRKRADLEDDTDAPQPYYRWFSDMRVGAGIVYEL